MKKIKNVAEKVPKEAEEMGGKVLKKIENVAGKVPKEAEEMGGKVLKKIENVAGKVPKEVKEMAGEVVEKITDMGEKITDVGGEIFKKAEGPIKQGLRLADKPLNKMVDVVGKLLPDMPPDKGPFKVDTKERTEDVLDALKDIPHVLVKIPEKAVDSGKKVFKKASHIPGLKNVEKVPGKILVVGKKAFTTARKTTRKLLTKIPIKKVLKKVEKIPTTARKTTRKLLTKIPIKEALKKAEKIPKEILSKMRHPCQIFDSGGVGKKHHFPKIPIPEVCGVKPTDVVKGIGGGIKNIGHSMIDGVKSVPPRAAHLVKGFFPTFVWAGADGKCPTSQKGGGHRRRRRVKHKTRRRRRRKTRRHKTRRHKTRRRKKRHKRISRRTRKKRKRRRKQRRTRRH